MSPPRVGLTRWEYIHSVARNVGFLMEEEWLLCRMCVMVARMVHFHFPNILLLLLLAILVDSLHCCNCWMMREAIKHPTYPDPTKAAVATLSDCAIMVVIVDRIGDDERMLPPRTSFNLLM